VVRAQGSCPPGSTAVVRSYSADGPLSAFFPLKERFRDQDTIDFRVLNRVRPILLPTSLPPPPRSMTTNDGWKGTLRVDAHYDLTLFKAFSPPSTTPNVPGETWMNSFQELFSKQPSSSIRTRPSRTKWRIDQLTLLSPLFPPKNPSSF